MTKITPVIKLCILALFIMPLALSLGCGTGAGCADVYLEGVTIGSLSVEGKPLSGLPSQKVDVVLNVNANRVTISTSGADTIITLSPSNATIVSTPNGITFTGVKPEQVEIEWQSTE